MQNDLHRCGHEVDEGEGHVGGVADRGGLLELVEGGLEVGALAGKSEVGYLVAVGWGAC